MIESRIVPGSEPAPATVDPVAMAILEVTVDIIVSGRPHPNWDTEALEALAELQSWVDRWRVRARDIRLTIEKVNEPSFGGPGRGVRLRAEWVEQNGAPGSRLTYPRLSQTPAIVVHSVRQFVEHVVRN